MIRYLKQEEKIRSRALWEEAFPEDSPEFADFYYEYRAADNQILVKEDEGRIESMAQLNPYEMKAGSQNWKIDYIVGVATRADRRHRGLMRAVLNKMLTDMYQAGKPFCFLMPADRRIYEPFQFTYIFDQPQPKVREDAGLESVSFEQSGMTLEALADWINDWLSRRYEVFCIRDKNYLKRFFKEIGSEAGQCELLYHKGELVGVRSSWGLEKREVREFLCQEQYLEKAEEDKPLIMARIVNLKEFVRAISLTAECPDQQLTVCLEVEDPLIEENQGRFWWHLDHEGSWIEPVKCPDEKEKKLALAVSIEQLTSWLFGYSQLEQAAEIKQWIRGLDGIYIDEIV